MNRQPDPVPIETEPEAPENAAEEIAEQVGTVKVPLSFIIDPNYANYLMFAQPAMSLDELKANDMPLVYTTKDKKTGEFVPMVQSMIARVIMTEEESAKKALGIYTDSVTFKIEKINVDSQ